MAEGCKQCIYVINSWSLMMWYWVILHLKGVSPCLWHLSKSDFHSLLLSCMLCELWLFFFFSIYLLILLSLPAIFNLILFPLLPGSLCTLSVHSVHSAPPGLHLQVGFTLILIYNWHFLLKITFPLSLKCIFHLFAIFSYLFKWLLQNSVI